jgi:predicted DNA-binding protein (MmcQ/YjbR family)
LLSKKGAFKDFPFGPVAAVFKVVGKMFALVAWQDKPLRVTLKGLHKNNFTELAPRFRSDLFDPKLQSHRNS